MCPSCNTRRLAVLTHPSLLMVDEIGYLPVSHTGAVLFFKLMNRRYEHASTVLMSNKAFEEWGEVLGDEVLPPRSSIAFCITVISSISAATAIACASTPHCTELCNPILTPQNRSGDRAGQERQVTEQIMVCNFQPPELCCFARR